MNDGIVLNDGENGIRYYWGHNRSVEAQAGTYERIRIDSCREKPYCYYCDIFASLLPGLRSCNWTHGRCERTHDKAAYSEYLPCKLQDGTPMVWRRL